MGWGEGGCMGERAEASALMLRVPWDISRGRFGDEGCEKEDGVSCGSKGLAGGKSGLTDRRCTAKLGYRIIRYMHTYVISQELNGSILCK
jgi:hypothetical protein